MFESGVRPEVRETVRGAGVGAISTSSSWSLISSSDSSSGSGCCGGAASSDSSESVESYIDGNSFAATCFLASLLETGFDLDGLGGLGGGLVVLAAALVALVLTGFGADFETASLSSKESSSRAACSLVMTSCWCCCCCRCC